MAKPEWGTKRKCQGCGAHFYDLKRDPIVCPKCETVIKVPKPTAAAGGASHRRDEGRLKR